MSPPLETSRANNRASPPRYTRPLIKFPLFSQKSNEKTDVDSSTQNEANEDGERKRYHTLERERERERKLDRKLETQSFASNIIDDQGEDTKERENPADGRNLANSWEFNLLSEMKIPRSNPIFPPKLFETDKHLLSSLVVL